MYPTENYDTDWQEFEKTGSVISYLKYKGIDTQKIIQDKEETSSSQIGDGETFGYH